MGEMTNTLNWWTRFWERDVDWSASWLRVVEDAWGWHMRKPSADV
jgi:hypothetical protein